MASLQQAFHLVAFGVLAALVRGIPFDRSGDPRRDTRRAPVGHDTGNGRLPAPQFRGTFYVDPAAAPDFELTRADGTALHISNLQVKTVLMFFGFAWCPDVCPITLADARRIDRRPTQDPFRPSGPFSSHHPLILLAKSFFHRRSQHLVIASAFDELSIDEYRRRATHARLPAFQRLLPYSLGKAT